MDERRRKLIAMPDHDYRIYIDEKFDRLKKQVVDSGEKCEVRFSQITDQVRAGRVEQAIAMKNNTDISQAALDGINSMKLALSGTIITEAALKTGAEVVGKGVVKGSTLAKILVPLVTLGGIIWAIAHGKWPA